MNEIDLKTKIEGLEKAIHEHKADANRYEDQLKQTQQELKDYNKVELTPAQLDDIQEAIEAGIENYSFSNIDNYEKDFSLDYDGRVQLESIDLQHLGKLYKTSRFFLYGEWAYPLTDDIKDNFDFVYEKVKQW